MGKPKKKTRNPGVGVDFKRVKHKVGKKLPRAKNETDTDFTSRSISLPSQGVREDRSGIAVNFQNLTLKELLNQTSHHNDKSRKHSLAGLSDLFGRHPEQLRLHAAQVLGTLAERIVDGDSSVRSALRSLLNDSVLPVLGPDALRPFMPVTMAHVCGAMTHLSLDVRNDALLFLDVMMDHAPRLVVDGFLAPCLAHFCDLFSATHRGRSIRAQSLSALSKLLVALTSFLRRAFPEAVSAAGGIAATGRSGGEAAAAAAGGGAGAAVPDGDAAAAAAGPGPSSIRQHAASHSLRYGATLGADRARRPSHGAGELLGSLDELFRAAAAATRAGRTNKSRGKSGAGGGGAEGVDKGRGKKGRGSVSTMETPTSAHQGSGGGPGSSGGKGVAAAAAALAAVTAPAAAAAAGMDLSGAAAGALGAPTTMAAALAAASDARASALRLVSLLMDCWLECTPAQLATAPELEQASALAMISTASNTLIQRLLLPPPPAGGPGGADGGAQGQPQQVMLMQQLHEIVARRVAVHFPATMPPVKPSPPVAEALVRLNLQSAELLSRFLPLAAAGAAAAGGNAVAAAELPWAHTLVSYYVGVLEHGVLLPAAAGTLSDTAPAAAQGLPSSASDAVLAAVSAAVQDLDDSGAQRLMTAVGEFASRQSPRSVARLACIRMQHGLLKAALAGRLFLEDGVVAGWLTPLPKLLWEAGATAPDASAAALLLLLDAARFAAPGSAMCTYLSTTLQPQLAPLFATQLPPKAAKAALAKRAAVEGGKAGACASEPGGVVVLLPGVVSKLPDQVACLAVDLIYHTGALGTSLLKPLAAALSSCALPPALALRLLGMVMSRLRDAPDPALAASWLLTVLFGPQHGQLVLSPDGSDLTSGWDRQRALVDTAALGIGCLGGALPLLHVLAPQLTGLPLAVAESTGAPAARMQRYSFLRLCAAAQGELGGGGLPGELLELLPAAAALCGLELGAGAVEQEAATVPLGAAALGSETYGPLVQLLSERPALVTPVVERLAEVLQGRQGSTSSPQSPQQQGDAAVGRLPLHTAALAVLRLALMAVRLQPVRSALVVADEREGLVAAASKLVAAVRGVPVATGSAAAASHVAACVVESQRLAQTVADLYGSVGS